MSLTVGERVSRVLAFIPIVSVVTGFISAVIYYRRSKGAENGQDKQKMNDSAEKVHEVSSFARQRSQIEAEKGSRLWKVSVATMFPGVNLIAAFASWKILGKLSSCRDEINAQENKFAQENKLLEKYLPKTNETTEILIKGLTSKQRAFFLTFFNLLEKTEIGEKQKTHLAAVHAAPSIIELTPKELENENKPQEVLINAMCKTLNDGYNMRLPPTELKGLNQALYGRDDLRQDFRDIYKDQKLELYENYHQNKAIADFLNVIKAEENDAQSEYNKLETDDKKKRVLNHCKIMLEMKHPIDNLKLFVESPDFNAKKFFVTAMSKVKETSKLL